MFVVPAAFYKPHREHFDILVKSAAIMNVTPIIAVNQCGMLINNSQRGFVGGSVILDAKGARRSVNHVEDVNDIDYKYQDNKEKDEKGEYKIDENGLENNFAEKDDENMEGYILGEIDKNFTRISREANPEYTNRRIDLYKEWL